MEYDEFAKETLKDWKKLFRDRFGLKWSCLGAAIPKREPGFNRLLVAPKELKLKRIFECLDDLTPTMSTIDLSAVESMRSDGRDDIVWTRDRQEADEELEGLSAEDVRKMGLSGITLEHRLLFEMKYFLETGEHLDNLTMSICSGSRFGNIWIPDACYMTHLVVVSETHYDAIRPGRRVRQCLVNE